MKPLHFPSLLILFLLYAGFHPSVYADTTQTNIIVAVRAINGEDPAKQKWSATIDYLSRSIEGYSFKLLPVVGFKKMQQLINKQEVDFVLTNPSTYIELEAEYDVTRIATLINQRGENATQQFGAVIFTRSDNKNINDISDLKNHSIMGVHRDAFGGWRMALGEFNKHGIDTEKDFSEVIFEKNAKQIPVVFAVRDGKVDAGTVRTGILEHLAQNGEINLNDFKIIGQKEDDFHLPHSTTLYPEWPFSRLKNTPSELTQKVLVALLNMKSKNQAAKDGNYTGWTVPLDYSSIHDLMKQLHVGPYTNSEHTYLVDTIKKDWLRSIFILIGISIITLSAIYAYRKKNTANQKNLSIVIKISILSSCVAAVATLIVGTMIINGSADIMYENALNRLKYETNIKSLRLLSDINILSSDLRYLVDTPPVSGIPRAIENGGIDPLDNSHVDTWRQRLTTIFTGLIHAKPNYVQIRYIGIDNNGKEMIRVERNGNMIRLVPEDELQHKGDTTYFKNASKVDPGDVYLSDISLNMELGEFSTPHTPVIRAATPVFINEKLFGVLVINMEFKNIFDALIKDTPRQLTPYITNEDGYFLAHPDKDMTYGFELGHENTIQTIYPSFRLKEDNDIRDIEYTLETKGDVIHVVKANFDPKQEDRYFAMMLATSSENLNSGSTQLKRNSYTIMWLLILAILVIAAFLVSRMMRPLRYILTASEDLAMGRKVTDLPIESKDELGELACSFNKMRLQLEDKERELILSQGRVHHSNKMAALGEMAAGMAHEINSPVQAISLVAQRVQRQLIKNIPAEDIHNSMDKIISSINKISEIIDSLRKVSRNSTDDNFVDTNLIDIVSDITNMTEERFKVNNVHFEIIYHGISQNTIIQCQRLQISQVVINMVNNAYDAIQYDNDKWIKIILSQTGDKILIAVTDSGKGIEDDIVEKLFEPMFTTKDVGKGTGLGLSISREISLKHKGSLYFDPACDNTRFVLEIPIIQNEKQ